MSTTISRPREASRSHFAVHLRLLHAPSFGSAGPGEELAASGEIGVVIAVAAGVAAGLAVLGAVCVALTRSVDVDAGPSGCGFGRARC